MKKLPTAMLAAMFLLGACAAPTQPPDLKADLESCGLALLVTGSTDYKVLRDAALASPACMRLPGDVLVGLYPKTVATLRAQGVR